MYVVLPVCVCSKKACKYFDQGRGSCPFGGKCLYLHAFPDGSRAEPDRQRKQLSSEGNIRVRVHRCCFDSKKKMRCADLGFCSLLTLFVFLCVPQFMNSVRLWDFIEEREQRSVPPLAALDDDMAELTELFMQMSGPNHERPETPPTPDQ